MAEKEAIFTEDGKEILKKVPFTGAKRAAGLSVHQALQTMAQTSSFVRINMEPLQNLKKQLEESGNKVSVTVLILKLVSIALEASPMLNASLVGNKIEVYRSKNFAVAIATKDGLLFNPVIRNVQDKNILEIAAELKELTRKANAKELTADDFAGATYTVSSIGKNEMCAGTPVVITPQVGILMIGNTKMEPIVDDEGNIVAKPIAYFSHSIDHRVVAGKDTSTYYTRLVEVFKYPEEYIKLP